MNKKQEQLRLNYSPMLNAYPDSMGGSLGDIVKVLQMPEFDNIFGSFYILPSVFNTDLDRGFSVIDYELNNTFASKEDLKALEKMKIDLKFDFVLNHCSVLSKQFQDIVKNGKESKYKDFFIDWNEFWEGHGEMTDEGYIMPDEELIQKMFFRKPGLPILNVRMPDGEEVPYWNTFYQEVKYYKVTTQQLMKELDIQYLLADKLAELVNESIDEGKEPKEINFGEYENYRDRIVEILESNREYLGQVDLNVKSPLVWEYYKDTLKKLNEYGASIVRLDAFAYVSKEVGEENFFNVPGTWDILAKVKEIADQYNLTLLPEIHSKYEEKIHEELSDKGFMIYDFFLPGLIIDALERNNNEYIIKWIEDIKEKDMNLVNMLGCHDGIPLLDLKGLLPDEKIDSLIETVIDRGGHVKDLHGKKNMYYQVNSTYYSALGESDEKLLLSRAIQMFMPGKPQIWYLDLLAGTNDYDAVEKAGPGGHKEINRTNLTIEEIKEALTKDLVKDQIKLIRFRNQFPAFGYDGNLQVIDSNPNILELQWSNKGFTATLKADLNTYQFEITGTDDKGQPIDVEEWIR